MKRLVCSLDGTWNDDGPWPLTNVAKLHHSIPPRDRRCFSQLVRYIAGLATTEGLHFSFLRGAVGLEVGARIRLAYEFLSDVYQPGDEIYLFGFSRGAYEARSLASFVTLFGIARANGNFSFDEAWKLYRQSDHKRDVDTLARLSAECHYPVRIRAIGVWDTVGNIGNPIWGTGWLSRLMSFHDMRLHDTIDVALHALSIDEVRGPFRPTLFTLPEGTTLAPHQHVEQAWFAGTHADVGGGWPETELSDIALLWMAERVAALTGLAIDIDALKGSANPNPLGLQHHSAGGKLSAFSRLFPFIRLIDQDPAAISRRRRQLFRTWRSSKLRLGLTSLNETIHESALARFGQTVSQARGRSVEEIVYQPRSLAALVEPPTSHMAEPEHSAAEVA
jgi:uncharacterized protein (DUF2235 family)